jgi:MFS family permease
VRSLLLLVGAIVFVDTMFFAALTPLLPEYKDEFDLSKAGAGVLAGAYHIGALVGGVPAGIATARLGARATAIAGLLMIAATTFVFATGDSIVVLDASRPHMVPMHDPVSQVVYAARADDVTHVAVEGRLLYEDRRFATLDLERVVADARRAGERAHDAVKR